MLLFKENFPSQTSAGRAFLHPHKTWQEVKSTLRKADGTCGATACTETGFRPKASNSLLSLSKETTWSYPDFKDHSG